VLIEQGAVSDFPAVPTRRGEVFQVLCSKRGSRTAPVDSQPFVDNEILMTTLSDAEKRRTTRVVKHVPLTVTGTDALGQSFRVVTETVSVSCHGCKYRSKQYVPKYATVSIEIACPGLPLRVVSGRVIWIQRPRKIKQEFEISLEFDKPENLWGIDPPPEDWVPFSKSEPPPEPELDNPIVEIQVPAPAKIFSLPPAPTYAIKQPETGTYDMTTLQAESQDAEEESQEAEEKSLALLSDAAITQIAERLAGPLAATIAEKVCQEMAYKLDVIENTVREAVNRERDQASKPRPKGRSKSRNQQSSDDSLVPVGD
jgi:hypothetical protein